MSTYRPWHKNPKIRAAWENRAALKTSLVQAGHTPSSPEWGELASLDRKIAAMVWADAKADVEEDRRKHPKAKRNMGVGAESSAPTRYI